MRYSDILAFVTQGLQLAGYVDANPDTAETARTLPLFNPGPPTAESLLNNWPSTVLFLTVGNGVGMTTEQMFDQVFITTLVIGLQNDYDGAEALAYDVDNLLLSVGSNTKVGTAQALYISRTGGPPQLVDFDSGQRYHFQNTYITEAARV